MTTSTCPEHLVDRAKQLKALYDTTPMPFPRVDCHTLVQGTDIEPIDLITYWDLYDGALAGDCSCGTDILTWTVDMLLDEFQWTAVAFVERYPQFAPIWGRISEEITPQLYLRSRHIEKERTTIHELVRDVLLECHEIRV